MEEGTERCHRILKPQNEKSWTNSDKGLFDLM